MGEKTCLVIGGGRGMGAATAKEMHKRGYKLSLMSPSDSCEHLAENLKGIALRGKAEKVVIFTIDPPPCSSMIGVTNFEILTTGFIII